ncbi:MAG: hypothetical protein H3C31_01090 [Brumimicrobium sp.]|nr:hypothetical protein [Brumimicrobium sp.]
MKLTGLCLFICLLGIASCKKKELSFTFKGKVTAAYTNQGLEGVQIYIYASNLANNTSKSATAYTNANGEYEIVLERLKFDKVSIEASKNLHFSEKKLIKFDDLSTQNDNIVNFTMNAKAWARITAQNLNDPQPGDNFKILKLGGKVDCEECSPNGKYTFWYDAFNSSYIFINDGQTYFKYYYWYNDTVVHGLDSILTTPFDTITKTYTF